MIEDDDEQPNQLHDELKIRIDPAAEFDHKR